MAKATRLDGASLRLEAAAAGAGEAVGAACAALAGELGAEPYPAPADWTAAEVGDACAAAEAAIAARAGEITSLAIDEGGCSFLPTEQLRCEEELSGGACSDAAEQRCPAGAFEEPRCAEPLTAPSCTLDPTCVQLCAAEGLISVACAEPTVSVEASDPAVAEALETGLAAILAVTAECPSLLDAASELDAAGPLLRGGACEAETADARARVEEAGALAQAACGATAVINAADAT